MDPAHSIGLQRTTAIVVSDDEPLTFDYPTPTYTYTDLTTADYFRLLELLPGKGSSALQCNIQSYRLDAFTLPPYRALSYSGIESQYENLVVAGQKILIDSSLRKSYEFRHPLFCNNQTLLITTSLRDALQRIRHARLPVKLWVDAICINQENVIERSSHARMIPRIYRRATNVIAWLGEADEDSDKAITTVQRMVEEIKHGRSSTNILSSEDIKSFVRFLKRPIFRRLWCVVETVVAKDARILCGSLPSPNILTGPSISYERLGWVCQVMRSLVPQHIDSLDEAKRLLSFCDLAMQARLGLSIRKVDPYQLAYDLREYESTDPLDKVFAFYALPRIDCPVSLGEVPVAATQDELARLSTSDPLLIRKLTINWAQTKWEQHAGFGPLSSASTRIDALVEHVSHYYRTAIRLLECVLESCTGGSQEEISVVFSKLWEAVDRQQTSIRRFLDKDTDEIASSDELVIFRRISTDLETSLWLYEDICTSHVDSKYGPEDAPYLRNRIEAFEEMQNCLSTAGDSSSSFGSNDSDEDLDQAPHSFDPSSEILSSGKGEATQNTEDEAPAKDSISETVGGNRQVSTSSGEGADDRGDSGPKDIENDSRLQRDEGHVPAEIFLAVSMMANGVEPRHAIGLEYMAPRIDGCDSTCAQEGHDHAVAESRSLASPDYSLSTAEAYRAFTVQCLLHDQNLDLLSSVDAFCQGGRVTGLPSWVPDYSIKLDNRIVPLVSPEYHGRNVFGGIRKVQPEIFWEESDPNTLELTGRFFDTISAVSTLRSEIRGFKQLHEEWMRMTSREIGVEPAQYLPPHANGDDEEAYDRVWKGTMAMPDSLPIPPPARIKSWRHMIRDFMQWFHHWHSRPDGLSKATWQCYFAFLALLAAQQSSATTEPALKRALEEGGIVPGVTIMEDNEGFFEAVQSLAVGRRLAVTKAGGVTWVPETTQVGDMICVMKGAKVPFVIRKVSGTESSFQFIGECFCHELAYLGMGDDSTDWTTICLI
ncbi:Heterokaryon incompatibility [Penicillium griseofulvum]|uniref:Heterokaryon incompatibility n=1 Tax=Penicillium patulum TaxID=5078 RepID=A0A135LR12_PENPA|nr:Heterokaryon incompatibility [Penicillium griseofulvum]KXG51414.1 Heterokaryon incompatibility [Penicillium griseofulvum]